MGNSKSFLCKSNTIKQGRWIFKTNKQIEINEYWNNIDHCGDKICGDLYKNKSFYKNNIIKNNKNYKNNKKYF
tara:strand:- start:836 stop:1054 length:219 start_codon:yes stop_codon:yes gene_type:complete